MHVLYTRDQNAVLMASRRRALWCQHVSLGNTGYLCLKQTRGQGVGVEFSELGFMVGLRQFLTLGDSQESEETTDKSSEKL